MTCTPVEFPTQIFVDSTDGNITNCLGVFSFLPDQYTDPVSTQICPLNVKILKNNRGDIKLSLLDDKGCILDNLVLKCSQYDISESVIIYDDIFDYPKPYVITLNGRNLKVMGEYVAFEEKAYCYRRVKQAYTNLWPALESTYDPDIMTNMLNPTYSPQSLALDLLKSRIISLKQLCECPASVGKICNHNFPLRPSTCSSFKDCCN